mmetsp:Transcript_46841/g.145044  ORF Transcript_46841/g.145044 Transcript_46841/m.145044 type:complete len:239 (+) Transcript_46841:447-1163(+)
MATSSGGRCSRPAGGSRSASPSRAARSAAPRAAPGPSACSPSSPRPRGWSSSAACAAGRASTGGPRSASPANSSRASHAWRGSSRAGWAARWASAWRRGPLLARTGAACGRRCSASCATRPSLASEPTPRRSATRATSCPLRRTTSMSPRARGRSCGGPPRTAIRRPEARGRRSASSPCARTRSGWSSSAAALAAGCTLIGRFPAPVQHTSSTRPQPQPRPWRSRDMGASWPVSSVPV